MKHLSRSTGAGLSEAPVAMPEEKLFELPEKVIQFGTGVLLRGLPDYLIDKANRQGIFNGRIVVVKSTDGGDIESFNRQDGMYTLCIRGIEDGQSVEENVVCSAISRVLSAKSQWEEILKCAANPELQIVLSNTTEVGIQLVPDDIRQTPPQSFPGKLLAFLYARFQAFQGDKSKGLVIVPTELIPENGSKLEAILLELAHRNGLESEFMDWLESANTCCNSLVDRIVPGRPDEATLHNLTEQLGYEDELLSISESFLLWAIQGDERVKSILSFHEVDKGIVIQPDINLFRELKLRLLNGTHTLSCGLAFLSGFETVRSAMEDDTLGTFISNLMLADLLPGIPYPVDEKVAQRFGLQVMDRFRNPFVEHRWIAITMQYTAKMQMRNIPTLMHYYKRFNAVPECMALGFAAYLLFMKGTEQRGATWYGQANGNDYPIQDEKAGYFAETWANAEAEEVVSTVLHNQALWGHDLTQLPGFAKQVTDYLQKMIENGAYPTVAAYFNKKTLAK